MTRRHLLLLQWDVNSPNIKLDYGVKMFLRTNPLMMTRDKALTYRAYAGMWIKRICRGRIMRNSMAVKWPSAVLFGPFRLRKQRRATMPVRRKGGADHSESSLVPDRMCGGRATVTSQSQKTDADPGST